ncbi:tetratricopeptide repeat protein [Thioflavicoccus mobilis 8321]|uniref:Tetratricopeptide repeat protein n=1 Tax=Thioflavicoccus mobilis 8321 TaxID=765912 RepID=L0H163_9GAMM|nr:tetratricopeptide repeat protein [Thioflavicoccus mobilis]AGA91951.1 tetratricopeptide repeat protein [Thioflavicoccus mobilis 8321]
MPKLRPWQWIVVVVFLFFYGFAVFALTRDYYLRHPEPPAAEAAGSAGSRTWLQEQMQGPAPDLDAALREADPGRLGQLADDLFSQGNYGEALPLYRRLLELTPDDIEVYNDLGLALHYSGQSGEAQEVLEEGVARDADYQRIWLTLGFVRVVSGDAAGAREALERARSLDPDTPVGKEAERLLGKLGTE